MELKFKAIHPKIGREIPLPQFATPGSAAMDLRACLDGPIVSLICVIACTGHTVAHGESSQ